MKYLIKIISICTILVISLFVVFGCSELDRPTGVEEDVVMLSNDDIATYMTLQKDISVTTSSLNEEFSITKPANNSWHVKDKPVQFQWTPYDHPQYYNETYRFYIDGAWSMIYTYDLIYNLYFSNVGTHNVQIACRYGPNLMYGKWSENICTVNICDTLEVSDIIGFNPFDSSEPTKFRVDVEGGHNNSYQWKVYKSSGGQVGNTITTTDLWTTQLPYMASGRYKFTVKVTSSAESVTRYRWFTNVH